MHTLTLLPEDQVINVTMRWDTVCHADGVWKMRNHLGEKDIAWMQSTLTDLKAKIEDPIIGIDFCSSAGLLRGRS